MDKSSENSAGNSGRSSVWNSNEVLMKIPEKKNTSVILLESTSAFGGLKKTSGKYPNEFLEETQKILKNVVFQNLWWLLNEIKKKKCSGRYLEAFMECVGCFLKILLTLYNSWFEAISINQDRSQNSQEIVFDIFD